MSGVFARAALRYWLTIFPRACVELRRWRRRAARIADPTLRRGALDALDKRGNIEGAAAFAVTVRRRRRGAVVRALVAYQALYNYVDMLAEQPSEDPVQNARCLHEALLVALDPGALDAGAPQPDYYARHPQCEDGGYLAEMVAVCRSALSGLPSHAAVAAPARRSAARIVAFQSLSLGVRDELEDWARTLLGADTPLQLGMDAPLQWWEAAAAAGSSLAVHALIAAAATNSLHAEDVAAIDAAYFPWIGALHSLLDSIVDGEEDAATGQLSLVGCYRSAREATMRMRWLAVRAQGAARALPGGRQHAVLAAGMACHYLSELDREPVRGVREAMGAVAGPALAVFRARRLAARLVHSLAGASVMKREPAAVRIGDGERGVDAGAA